MMISTAPRTPTVYVGTSSETMPDGLAVEVLRNEAMDVSPLALVAIRFRVNKLRLLGHDWDGYGSDKPDSDAIDATKALLKELFRGAALTQHSWADPHASANETGDVVLEWWRDDKKITLYVTRDQVSFVQVWGDNMDTEMAEGAINNPRRDFGNLWSWLHI